MNRLRRLWAEYKIDRAVSGMQRHGVICGCGGENCREWDDLTSLLDRAFDAFNRTASRARST